MQNYNPPASDRDLLLVLIDNLGVRYDDIRPSDDPKALNEWAHRLLVEWAEGYNGGYYQEPRKPN